MRAIFWLCLLAAASPAVHVVRAQMGPEECVQAEQQCAPPRMGWFSNVRAVRPPNGMAFVAADLDWDPITAMDYVVAYREMGDPAGTYRFTMRLDVVTSFRLGGLTPNTSYYITVCRPNVNVTFLSELDEPLTFRECGFCSTCYTTRAVELAVTLASHDVDLVEDVDSFQCQAFGDPKPNEIIWTAIDPDSGERVQLFQGDRNVDIIEESIPGGGIESFLEAPVAEDLLIVGQIECVAVNPFTNATAETRRFVEEDITPTREPTTGPPDPTTDLAADLNTSVPVPVWAIGLIVAIVVALVVGTVVGGLLVFWRYRRHSSKDLRGKESTKTELYQQDIDLRQKSNDYYDAKKINRENDLEDSFSLTFSRDKIIPSSMIKLSKVIGQGEFGVVYKGTLTRETSCDLVAVKTLKGIFSTDNDVKQATEEILKMQSFNHPNVMTLIGVCVSGEVGGSGGPSIIMPYMSKGSLLDYLRKEGNNIKPTSEADITQIGSVQKLLMQICVQIAKGMEYLANLKFVHRDLAARNCMIGHNGNIKVGDFGLAEDVYLRNYFRQSEGESVKLPIKWMAIESIKLGVFSEKSDVWSYGVTCWEVFTAGEIPYSGVHPRQVIRLLDNGERMDKPRNEACSNELYKLMLSCWDSEPESRPTFSQLVVSIESQLLGMADYLDLNIVTSNDDNTELLAVA